MRFGVNYIPSKKWLYSWADFDENSIREDIKAIKNLGFDHVRTHILWNIFQPNENYVSELCLENLSKFTKICEEEKMDFFLTLFTGWMSGMVFMPPWLNIGGFDCWKKGMFSNKEAIKAEYYLIEKVAGVVAKSSAFLGFDLGNELNCLFREEIDADLTDDIADEWSHLMFKKCYEAAPEKLHSNGMGHSPWFGKTAMSRKTLANDGSITPVHAWVTFTGTSDKYGINGKETYRLPNYMIEMAKAYSEDANRMYQVQEFGMADQWFKTNEELENFIFGTLENCASDKNIWGVTWWCSHDIKQEFLGFVDFEHNLGLIDTENKPKQAGIIFKKFIDNYKAENYIQPQPLKALVIQSGTGDECDFTNAQRYFDCYAKGENVAFVTEEMKNNTDYLVSRGIKEIIE